jgi:hypothetical protein
MGEREVCLARRIDCYCAFCRNPRRVYRKRSIGFVEIIQSFGLGAALTFLMWQRIDTRGLVIGLVILMFSEIAIQIRARLDAVCPHCGFDPILYVKNKQRAAEKVKLVLQQRQQDPDVWLGRKPPIRVSRRKKSDSTREIVI